MKFADVTSKGIRETVRDKRGFMSLIAFPIVLILIFSFAFGSGTFLSGGSLPHEIVVVNNDAGVTLTANNTTKYVNYGANFVNVLENATVENSTTNLFHLNNASQEKADALLKSRNIDALIVVPKNFSSALVTMVNNSARTAITSSVGQQAIANSSKLASSIAASTAGQAVYDPQLGIYVTPTPAPSVKVPGANVKLPKEGNVTSSLIIQGDAGYMNYASTQALIIELFDRYANGVQTNATRTAVPGTSTNLFANYVPVERLVITGTQSFSLYDYMVPGLIVFILLLQVTAIASSLVRDVEKGTLDRLKLSRVRSFDLLFGTFITWTLITVGQIILSIAVATALGYNYQGGFSSLGLALLIGVIAGMASIALALLIVSFVKTDMQSIFISAMIAAPLAFLAGAFLPLPRQMLGEFGGRTYQIYDILPWTHAVSALRSVLTYGSGLSADVVVELSWLIVLTAILFV
ncbi:MAG: ABC transporter permease, partial [Halobacteriota archaeon]